MTLQEDVRSNAKPSIPDLIHLAMIRYPESCGPMLGLMSNSDLTMGEVVGLHWDDIDFHKRLITVRRTIGDNMQILPPKKGEHTTPLTPEAMVFLAIYRNGRRVSKTTPQVFHNNGRYFLKGKVMLSLKFLAAELGMAGFTGRKLLNYFSRKRQLLRSMAENH